MRENPVQFRSPLTVQQLLDSSPNPLIESPRISGRLKREPELLVPSFPMMKRRHDLVVFEILPNRATQNDLNKNIKNQRYKKQIDFFL